MNSPFAGIWRMTLPGRSEPVASDEVQAIERLQWGQEYPFGSEIDDRLKATHSGSQGKYSMGVRS